MKTQYWQRFFSEKLMHSVLLRIQNISTPTWHNLTQLALTCSKSTMETPEQYLESLQSQQWGHQNNVNGAQLELQKKEWCNALNQFEKNNAKNFPCSLLLSHSGPCSVSCLWNDVIEIWLITAKVQPIHTKLNLSWRPKTHVWGIVTELLQWILSNCNSG